jgi:glycosyltransferase 2 family protein
VVVATLIAPLQIWVRGQRWWYLFPPGSNPPPLTPAMMIGYMANNVLPLRAGEVVRIYVVARRWSATGAPERIHPFWTTLATLVVERVLDSLVVVLILAILVLRVSVPRFLEMAALIVLTIDLVGIAVLVALAAAPDACVRLVARLVGRWPGLHRRLLNIFQTFVHGLDGVRTPSHAVPLVAWTVAVWLVPALAAWTMLLALDLHLPFIASWAVLSFVGLGISIPSAPGYVGVFHAAAVLAVGLFGVSHSAAVGYALLFHASQIVPITLAGWLYLLREEVSLTEATRAHPPRLS